MADDADEVKVFRTTDGEDIDAQTSQDLSEDKKDVVLEAEYEARQESIGSKTGGAFTKPQPSPSFAGLPPNFQPYSPGNYMNQMAFLMRSGMGYLPMMPMMSPTFMPCVFPPAAMSPNIMMNHLMMGQASPIYGALANVKMEPVQLPTNLRGNALNQMHRMMPFGGGSPMASLANTMSQDSRRTRDGKIKKEDHVKKPLNAFMWYMKETRPKMLEEDGYKEKQSADLNKELGRRWHDLPKPEQQKYFEMAKKDKEDHKAKYPQWSARENYAVNKRKKRRRDKTEENADTKKCRARFGNDNKQLWCKLCLRKKKCEYSYANSDGGNSSDLHDRVSASGSSGPSPMASSMGPSPLDPSSMDHNGSDSHSDAEFDVDADMEGDDDEDVEDATLTHSALQDLHGSMAASQPSGLC